MEIARLSATESRRLKSQLAQSKRKPKLNLKNIPARDQCQTPPYALLPLLPYIPKEWTVWECASGEGWLAAGLRKMGYTTIATDLLRGVDFFKTNLHSANMMITNVPFSIKYDWLRYGYGLNKPFAWLMPFDTWAAKSAQTLFQRHGICVILPDRRINFKMPSHKTWSDVYKPIKKVDIAGKVRWQKPSAQMHTAWFCWGLPNLTQVVTYATLPPYKDMEEWLYKPTSKWLKEYS